MAHRLPVVFWDVDTQFDFMTPPEEGGKLYVRDPGDPHDPGARKVLPELKAVSEYARQNGIPRVATGDWHHLSHREISDQPDFRDTFPPHCMADEIGSTKIPETALRNPVTIPLRASADTARAAARTAIDEGRDVFLQKEEFSCFTGNPDATEALIEELDPELFVVYGVALDVCVKHAVEGMLDRGKQVHLVRDATHGLGLKHPDRLVERWKARGVETVSTSDVLRGDY